jgi:hypothetical protein
MRKRVSGLYLSAVVSPGGSGKEMKGGESITAGALQKVARRMVPFYLKVARNGLYAGRWSDAVVKLNLDRLDGLLRLASPKIGRNHIGTNGIGYFVDFPFKAPLREYTNGTTIPPGTVQFVFEHQAHRAVAEAVLPLYRTLALNRRFAAELARAIRAEDSEAVANLVKRCVRTAALKSIAAQANGFALTFRFASSSYPYRNVLYGELPAGE